MERFCGRLGRFIKSRQRPDANMATYVLADARLHMAGIQYNILSELALRPTQKLPQDRTGIHFRDRQHCEHFVCFF